MPVNGLSKIIVTLLKKIQSFTLKTVYLKTVCYLIEEKTTFVQVMYIFIGECFI